MHSDTALPQALEHPNNDLRAIIADLYPEVRNPYGGRIKAVWRGGKKDSVSIRAHSLRDFAESKTYKTWKFLLEVAEFSKAEAAAYLLQRAGLGNDGPVRPTAKRTVDTKTLKAEETRKQAWLKARLEDAHQLQRTSSTTGTSGYLERKGVAEVFATHEIADVKLGDQTVPGMVYGSYKLGPFVQFALRTLEGKVVGYQRIYDGKVLPGERDKDFIGTTSGAFILLQPKDVRLPRDGTALAKLLDKGYEVGICEGVATGGSIALARPRAFVFCALTKNNLGHMLRALRERYGNTRMLGNRRKALDLCIWADHDENGRGQEAAHRAALQHDAYVRLPRIPGDFNDLHIAKGLEAVRRTRKITPDTKWAFDKDLGKQNLSASRDLPPFDLPEPGEALLVRAPQGSGKTREIKGALDRQPGLRVVAVVPRISLAKNMASRLEGDLYSKVPTPLLNHAERLIITYDSLYKLALDGKMPHADVVVLDESDQTLEHTTGRHIKHKAANEAVFEALLRDTPRIVCLDANLGSLTVNELRRTSPERRIKYLRHENHVAAGLHMDMVWERDDALDALDGETKPTWYATDSLRHSRDLSAYLDDPNTVTINSETSGEGDAAAYLLDPTAKAPKHQRLIASPTVQTGVSDESGHWQHVIGSFGGYSSTPQDAGQAIMRARGVKQVTVHVPRGIGRAVSLEDALEGAADLEAYEREALGEAADSSATTNYERRRAEVEAQRSRRKAHYKSIFARDATLLGYDVTYHLPTDLSAAELEQRKTRRQDLKNAGRELYINDRANAERVDGDAAALLDEAHSRTREQTYALEQYRLRDFYALPDDVSDDELRRVLAQDDYGAQRRVIVNYEGFLEPRAVAEARARGELDVRVIPGDKRGHMLRLDLTRCLGKVIGLDAETEATADTWQGQDNARDARISELTTERETANNHRKNAIDKELTVLEREKGTAKTETLSTRYGTQDANVKALVAFGIKNYQALRKAGVLTCPLEHLTTKTLEVIGDLLRQRGLAQVSDGKRSKRTYAVTIASILVMRNLSCPRRKNWDFAQQTAIKNSYHYLLRKNAENVSVTAQVTSAEIPSFTVSESDPTAYLTHLLETGKLEALEPQKRAVITRKIVEKDITWLCQLVRSRDLGQALGLLPEVPPPLPAPTTLQSAGAA